MKLLNFLAILTLVFTHSLAKANYAATESVVKVIQNKCRQTTSEAQGFAAIRELFVESDYAKCLRRTNSALKNKQIPKDILESRKLIRQLDKMNQLELGDDYHRKIIAVEGRLSFVKEVSEPSAERESKDVAGILVDVAEINDSLRRTVRSYSANGKYLSSKSLSSKPARVESFSKSDAGQSGLGAL